MNSPNPNLTSLLEGLPEVPLLGEGGDTSRDGFLEQVDQAASTLREAGVAPRQVVAVQLPNGPDLVATLFGVWRAGAVYTPINPRATSAEVERTLETILPSAMVTVEGTQSLDDGDELDSAVALVQYTSGTTGRPKPVPLRHDTVTDMLDRVVDSIRKPGATRPKSPPMPNLVPLSLSLWAGIYQVLFAFRVGAPAVLMGRFETDEFASLVARHEVRSTVLPPAALTMLTADETIKDLAPLRIVRSITAPLAPEQVRRFHDRFGAIVLNSYGQTELGGEIVGWSTADVRRFGADKLGSVGRVHNGVEVRAESETGELLARTPSTIGGLIAPGFRDRLLDDGWFRTGDLGRIDDDGFVWIEGRVSDMINRGGTKVFPAEVEEAILRHPGVREVAVVGVPDDRLGEVPVAFVVPVGDTIAHDDFEAWCRKSLVPYKIPVRMVMLDTLPRNDTGKVVKAELVEPATGENGSAVRS